jgi:3-methyl-2-oxobutanoate hydroxymethyltransferase
VEFEPLVTAAHTLHSDPECAFVRQGRDLHDSSGEGVGSGGRFGRIGPDDPARLRVELEDEGAFAQEEDHASGVAVEDEGAHPHAPECAVQFPGQSRSEEGIPSHGGNLPPSGSTPEGFDRYPAWIYRPASREPTPPNPVAHVSASSDTHRRRLAVPDFTSMKERGQKIAVLTCYDVLFARLLEDEGVDMLLVGDSLGQVVLGYDSTLPVTLDEMLHHGRAVVRGAPRTFVVLDLPFLTYQVCVEDAVRAGGRALKEAGVQAVKVEGGDEESCRTVQAMTRAGIPVMGHLGFTPQSVHALGGARVQGRDGERATRLRAEARALEAAGCFSVVLELMPGPLAAGISAELRIPTIGIGAGVGCDGQVLVLPDALGMNPGFTPRFLKRFADLDGAAREGVQAYLAEVRDGTYPAPEHTFGGEA